jgi:flagellar biogenesis protein FliO
MSDRLPASQPFDRSHRPVARLVCLVACLVAWPLAVIPSFGQTTNFASVPLTAPSLPDAGVSLFRVFGALALVVGLFLGGVWLFRNWQRVVLQRGRVPKLNVLETRSLGGRHALHVVGYEEERFLIASSPGGVNLLSHLPSAAEDEPPAKANVMPAPSFARVLARMLQGK